MFGGAPGVCGTRRCLGVSGAADVALAEAAQDSRLAGSEGQSRLANGTIRLSNK